MFLWACMCTHRTSLVPTDPAEALLRGEAELTRLAQTVADMVCDRPELGLVYT